MGIIEFEPATKGVCFLCLGANKPFKSDDDGLYPSQKLCKNTYSLQCLIQFLNLDMSNWSPSLSTTVDHDQAERSRLKAELCHECLHDVESFSMSFKKLQRIEMEVIWRLQTLQEKLKQGKRKEMDPTKVLKDMDSNSTNNESDKLNLPILDLLRTELLNKCSTKLKANLPRVPLQRLTWGQVDNEHLSKAENNSNIFVKSEPPSLVAMEDEQDIPNYSDAEVGDQVSDNAFEIEPNNSNYLDIKPTLSDLPMPHSMTSADLSKQQNLLPPKMKRKYIKGPCKCSYCLLKFKNGGLLASHKMKAHFGRNVTAPVQCTNCASHFLSESGFKYHSDKKVCLKRTKLNVLANQASEPNNSKTEDAALSNQLACHICSNQFKNLAWLSNHMKIIHNVHPKKQSCNNAKARGQHQVTTKHQCPYCFEKFSSSKQLESHRHHKCQNNKRYMCESCQKCFRKPYELRAHRRKVHNAERLKCEYCPGTFLLQTYLNRHTRECHGDVVQRPVHIYNDEQVEKSNDDGSKKSHHCEHCDKRYDTEKGLNHHLKLTHLSKFIHRFECNICLKNFKRVTHLKRHQTSVHQKLRYLCELCSGTFYDYDYMRLHMRTTCPNKVE